MDIIEWAEQRMSDIRMEEEQLRQFLDIAYDIKRWQVAAEAAGPSSKQQEIEQAVLGILKMAKEPLGTPSILDRLIELGIQLGGKDSKNTLSARLSNSKRFEYDKNFNGWWSKELPDFPF